MMQIRLNKKAIKFLNKQEKNVLSRIHVAIKGLKEIPPTGDVSKMKGMVNMFRLRVGTYRIVYEIDFQERIIYIHAIDNRGDIY